MQLVATGAATGRQPAFLRRVPEGPGCCIDDGSGEGALLILRAHDYALSRMRVALPWREPNSPPVPWASARPQFGTCTAAWASPRNWRTASITLVMPPRLAGWLLHNPP